METTQPFRATYSTAAVFQGESFFSYIHSLPAMTLVILPGIAVKSPPPRSQ